MSRRNKTTAVAVATPANTQMQPAENSILSVIANAASNPNVNSDKMQALLSMQKEIMAIEAEKSFNVSLAALQAEKPTVTKSGKVDYETSKGRTRYSHERYEDIDAAVGPLMNKYGFSFMFFETEQPGHYKGILLHKDGHSMAGYWSAAPDKSGGKNDVQAGGSTFTYVRRYVLKGLLNIVTIGEDDDAQSFSYLNAVQVAELETKLIEFEIDRAAFLKRYGVESLSLIMAKDFETVVRAINKRNANKAALKAKEGIAE